MYSLILSIIKVVYLLHCPSPETALTGGGGAAMLKKSRMKCKKSCMCDRAETMRACALKVSKFEIWKTTTYAVKSLIEKNRLNVFSIVI